MSERKEAGHSLFHEGGLVELAGSSRRRVTIAIRSLGDQRCAKGPERVGQIPSDRHAVPTNDDFSTAIRSLGAIVPRRAKDRILMDSCMLSRPNRCRVRICVPDPALVCLQVAFGIRCYDWPPVSANTSELPAVAARERSIPSDQICSLLVSKATSAPSES